MRGTIESPAERQRRFFMRRYMRLLKDTGSVTGEFLKLPRGAQALLGDGMDPLVLEEVAQGADGLHGILAEEHDEIDGDERQLKHHAAQEGQWQRDAPHAHGIENDADARIAARAEEADFVK